MLLIFSICSQAQTGKSVPIPEVLKGKKPVVDTVIINEPTDKKDISDVFRNLFHIKPSKDADSVTSKPELTIVPAIGYTLVSRLALVLSGNVAFRTSAKSRISTIVASASYTQNRQFIIPVLTNIWNKKNTFEFIGDYRYYKYPQNTYGLGSSSETTNQDPMDFSFARFYETALRNFAPNWFAGGGYALDSFWNISDSGTRNSAFSDYHQYGAQSHMISSGLTATLMHDSRDNSINPAKGWFGNLQYRNNSKLLGSTHNWQSVIIDLRKYVHFPEGSGNVLAFWSYNWLILNGHPNYLDLPSTSWDPNSATGRGYIQGRFRGAQMIYLESEYRFNITRNGLIGGVLFLNGQTLSAQPGTPFEKLRPAAGPGLRIKLNKTSNTNIAIDYGFGVNKSKGLFIDVGEIF